MLRDVNDTEFVPWRRLGDLLRAHREGAGLSVVQAAVKADFSESVWRQLEKGERRVGRDILPPNARNETLVRAARAVGLEPSVALREVGRNGAVIPNAPESQDDNEPVPPEIEERFNSLDRRLAGIEGQVAGLLQAFRNLYPDAAVPDPAPTRERTPGR